MSGAPAAALARDLLASTSLPENGPHLDALFTAASVLIESLGGKAPARSVEPAPRRRRRRRKLRAVAAKAPRAPRKPRAQAREQQPAEPRAESHGGGQAAPAEPPEILEANGVSVAIAADVAAVAFNGSAIDCAPKDGRAIAILARAMPHPVDPSFVASKIVTGRYPEGWLDGLVRRTAPALATIGLRLQKVGVTGFSLQPTGGE